MPPTIEGNFFACVGVLVCGVSFVGVRVFVGLGESETEGEVVGEKLGESEGVSVGVVEGVNEGRVVGEVVGEKLGESEGISVGVVEGVNKGRVVGEVVGRGEEEVLGGVSVGGTEKLREEGRAVLATVPPTIEGNLVACVGVLVCGVSFVGVRVFVGLREGVNEGEVVARSLVNQKVYR